MPMGGVGRAAAAPSAAHRPGGRGAAVPPVGLRGALAGPPALGRCWPPRSAPAPRPPRAAWGSSLWPCGIGAAVGAGAGARFAAQGGARASLAAAAVPQPGALQDALQSMRSEEEVISTSAKSFHLSCFVGTQVRARPDSPLEKRMVQGVLLLEAGYGRGAYTNKSTGVSITLTCGLRVLGNKFGALWRNTVLYFWGFVIRWDLVPPEEKSSDRIFWNFEAMKFSEGRELFFSQSSAALRERQADLEKAMKEGMPDKYFEIFNGILQEHAGSIFGGFSSSWSNKDLNNAFPFTSWALLEQVPVDSWSVELREAFETKELLYVECPIGGIGEILTALFAELPVYERKQFDYMGRLTAYANPWARLFYSDVESISEVEDGEDLLARLQGSFLALWWDKELGEAFCKLDCTVLRWMAKIGDAEPSLKAAKAAGKGPSAGGARPQGAAAKKQTIDELVVVLAKLVLSDEAELMLLIGAVYDTWLVPLTSHMVELMLEENQAFNAEAQEAREKEKHEHNNGNKDYVKPKMAAPFLRVFATMIQGAAEKEAEDMELAAARVPALKYFEGAISKLKEAEEMSDLIRFCRAKRLKGNNMDGEELVKVQFLISHEHDLAKPTTTAIRTAPILGRYLDAAQPPWPDDFAAMQAAHGREPPGRCRHPAEAARERLPPRGGIPPQAVERWDPRARDRRRAGSWLRLRRRLLLVGGRGRDAGRAAGDGPDGGPGGPRGGDQAPPEGQPATQAEPRAVPRGGGDPLRGGRARASAPRGGGGAGPARRGGAGGPGWPAGGRPGGRLLPVRHRVDGRHLREGVRVGRAGLVGGLRAGGGAGPGGRDVHQPAPVGHQGARRGSPRPEGVGELVATALSGRQPVGRRRAPGARRDRLAPRGRAGRSRRRGQARGELLGPAEDREARSRTLQDALKARAAAARAAGDADLADQGVRPAFAEYRLTPASADPR
ncbi:unnamed protein product, partial [Prorocentrum cordatum]